MVRLLTSTIVLLITISLCKSYTIVYKNSEKHCKDNIYTHVYDYLEENKYCFKLQWCDEEHCCFHECSAYSWRAVQVSILNTVFIPPKAFAESDSLRYISGIQQNIATLASTAFVNLSNIQEINLSFNKIRYIQHDVFVNTAAKILDLSWNKLMYIDQDAFSGMKNLEILLLDHNELSYFYSFPKGSALKTLRLSYNFLQRLVVSGKRFPQLLVLDASFNNLTNVAVSSEYMINSIDFRNNFLEKLDLFKVEKVLKLTLGNNKFEMIDLSICEKVRTLYVYPNPWNSTTTEEEIFQRCGVFDAPRQNHIIEPPKDDQELPAFCLDDFMCPDNKICRTNRCFDPCKQGACDSTSICRTDNHVYRCDCQSGAKRNPVGYQSPCFKVECFVDKECPNATPCNTSTNTCDSSKTILHNMASSTMMSYPWYYDELDPVLGQIVYDENFYMTQDKDIADKI